MALVLGNYIKKTDDQLALEYFIENRIPPDELKSQIKNFILEDPKVSDRQIKLALLGRRLFFDSNLSQNQKVSCATCHQPDRSFTDGLPKAIGLQLTNRNTPTIINSFSNFWFFWDGRADSLAAQAIGPLENEKEHGITRSHLVQHILKHYRDEYEELFGPLSSHIKKWNPRAARPFLGKFSLSDKVLDSAITSLGNPKNLKELSQQSIKMGVEMRSIFSLHFVDEEGEKDEAAIVYERLPQKLRDEIDTMTANIGLAIEAYELGLVANQSPFDNFAKAWIDSSNANPQSAFNPQFGAMELLGFAVFAGKGECTLCHSGGNFSDNQFHNIGLPQITNEISLGRSVGIKKALRDPFNCKGRYSHMAERQFSESCRDLPFLDPDSPEAIGSFKTPSLRNVAQTAPYMHDGRFSTIDEVLRHYNSMNTAAAVGFREESLRPLRLSQLEMDSLQLFLISLTSPIRDLTAINTVH